MFSEDSQFFTPSYRRSGSRRYSILKFNGTLKIDPGKWATTDCTIRMSREDNKEQAAASEIRQVCFFPFFKAQIVIFATV